MISSPRRRSSLNVCLSLIAILACGLLSQGIARAQGTTTYWDGVTNGPDNPASAINLGINDMLILSATPSANPDFKPIDAYYALSSTIQYAVAANNAYVGYSAGDSALYYYFKPYADLSKVIVPSLMPNLVVNSDPVFLAGTLKQDNVDTPDFLIPFVGTTPSNVWPFTIASSDVFDSSGMNFRVDMQNAQWVMLSGPEDASVVTQLLVVQGDYSVDPDQRGNTYSINLEHVVFANGTGGQGGAIYFQAASGISPINQLWSTCIVNGDVAFYNNTSTVLSNSGGGGAVFAWAQSMIFAGDAIFIGNRAGAYYDAANANAFSFQTGTVQQGTGGAIRLYTSGSRLTFRGGSEFDGNMAGGSGGAMATFYGGVIEFFGKSIFMGNRSGVYMDLFNSGNRNWGGGGAIATTTGSGSESTSVFDLRFHSEAYFVGNQASGAGGAIFADSTRNAIVKFWAPTMFTDNTAGYEPQTVTLYMNVMGGGYPTNPELHGTYDPVAGLWTGTTVMGMYKLSGTGFDTGQDIYIQKVGWGGAVGLQVGSLAFFQGAPVDFERNMSTTMGGAIAILVSGNDTSGPAGNIGRIGATFYDSASFLGNIAAQNGGAIAAGTYGSSGDGLLNVASSGSGGGVYFNGGNHGSLTVAGNIAWWGNPDGTEKDVYLGNSTQYNKLYSFGGGGFFVTSGAYVEQVYNFTNNQTGGDGGAIQAGFIAAFRPTLSQYGSGVTPYALILNPLDWYQKGTFSQSGTYALFQNNVAMRDGGAIAATGSANVYIGSGAKFINNYAGGAGGAIQMGEAMADAYMSITGTLPPGTGNLLIGSTGTMMAGILDLRARVADIIFSGNRAGVTVDASTVDYDILRDPSMTASNAFSGTAGYMTVNKTSGYANDINVSQGSALGGQSTTAISGTINIDAYESMKVYFNGGITQTVLPLNTGFVTTATSGTVVTTSTTYGVAMTAPKNLVVNINQDADKSTFLNGAGTPSIAPIYLSNTNAVGLVWFDNASADIYGITTVGSGTLRISGTTTQRWGLASSATQAGTSFILNAGATLEANAIITANTITLTPGATVRVLGGGTLAFNAGPSGVQITPSPAARLNLAGNGIIIFGTSNALANSELGSLSLGDLGHTTAQVLTIAKDATTLADIKLADGAVLTAGLFANTSDQFVANTITLNPNAILNLTSFAPGNFTLATASNPISFASTPTSIAVTYKGTQLYSMTAPGGRLIITPAVNGNNITLAVTANNLALTWNGASGDSLTSFSGKMAGGAADYVLGDSITFGSGHTGNVSVDENIGLSGMTVTDGYTFSGSYGITTQTAASAPGDGGLTINAAGKTVYLYNGVEQTDTMYIPTRPTGQRNDFTGGILIQSGTLAVFGQAQLGAALSQITFANTTNTGAALLVVADLLLDGATGLHSQQLNLASGNIATIATSRTNASLTVANNTVAGYGGVFNVGANATLNLSAQGDMSFLGNSAASGGGALALASGAIANINVDAGATVMFGQQDDRVYRLPANTSKSDSIYGAAGSVINESGAGLLSINSDSPDFSGALNVGGKVAFGPGSNFGNPDSQINVASGGVLGGAATFNGTVNVNSGATLSIDGGPAFGLPPAAQAQIQTFNGALNLNNATVTYGGLISTSGEYTSDVINAAQTNITGTTTINFDRLPSGIAMGQLISSAAPIDTANLSAGTTGTDGLLYVNGITAQALPGTDYALTKGGIAVDLQRTDAWMGYKPVAIYLTAVREDTGASGTVTLTGGNLLYNYSFESTLSGTGAITVTGSVAYDTTQLVLISNVYNQKAYWMGTNTNAWNNTNQNWFIQNPNDPGHQFEDNSFFDGDSVVIGADRSPGQPYDINSVVSGTIDVDPAGVQVADMTITGTGTWVFTGGAINSNAGANNYKKAGTDVLGNPIQIDMSTGQLLLDENFTGLVVLANSGNTFPGVFVGGTKTDGFVILSGTLESTANTLSGNTITNNSTLIFGQSSNATFVGYVHGTGDVIKIGTGTLTVNSTGRIDATNVYLTEGGISVNSLSGLTVADSLYQAPLTTLVVNQELNAARYYNAGRLMRQATALAVAGPSSTSARLGGMVPPNTGSGAVFYKGRANTVLLDGDYIGDVGSTIVVNTYRDGIYADNYVVKGNSSGVSTVILRNIAAMPQSGQGWAFTPGNTDLNLDPVGVFTNTSAAGPTLASGTFFRNPTGVNPSLQDYAPSRDTLIFATEGATRELKLVMDWQDSYIGQTVEYPVITTSTMIQSGSTIVTTVTETGTAVGQNMENYHLVEGRDNNWYLRNQDITPADHDLAFIAGAPAMADLINKANIKAVYQHINARHDPLKKGVAAWLEYMHSQDTVRTDYYYRTLLRQNSANVGADYTFADWDKGWRPGVKVGVSYAFTDAQGTRPNPADIDAASTMTVNMHTFNAYAEARSGFLYLDAIVNYSPSANYKTDIPTSVPFDANAEVKGSRMGFSGEFGAVITPKGAGQLEVYVQATSAKNKFNKVSNLILDASIDQYTDLTGYNPIYDPNSAAGNGRRYYFDNLNSLYGEAGLRWGSHLQATENITVRPWGGVAYGRNISNSYNIYQDGYKIDNDMTGYYYIFRGGVAAQWRQGIQLYATIEWGGGTVTNNYTLSTGLNYHW